MNDPRATLSFIVDEPAAADFFDTHSPVATAVAASIRANPSLKVVGILGRWGSGKSTIVREIKQRFQVPDSPFRVFEYDAWLHQHDPLRRSFLESLGKSLWSEGLISEDTWKKRLSKLAGALEIKDTYQTPTVSPEGKLFFILGAIFSLGTFLARDSYKDALSDKSNDLSLSGLRAGLIMMSASVIIWCGRWLLNLVRSQRTDFLPRILLNKELTHVNLQTLKDVEPTSIEFGDAFRDMMKDVFSKRKKMIIVIDNIDRLPEKDAMELWSNIRIFFLSARSDNDLGTESYHPIVILPVDAQSISQMFSIGADSVIGDKLANSFINKTFDVTFEVPAQVMSDWKRYLKHQMEDCLGSAFTEERFFRTRQFMENWFEISSTPITPREINKSLNRVIALIMQWGLDKISYEVLSYYAINKRQIENNILNIISADNQTLELVAPDWRREIAAVHFGVDLEYAAQVLIEQPMRQLILDGAAADLSAYRAISGYGDVFESISRDLPADEGHPAPNIAVITNAAIILDNETKQGTAVWQPPAWRNLIREFGQIERSSALVEPGRRLLPLIAHVEREDVERLMGTIEIIVDATVSADTLQNQQAEQLAKVGIAVIELAQRFEVEPPIFDFKGEATRYLSRIYRFRTYPRFQSRIRSDADHGSVVDGLVARIADQNTSESVPALLALLTSPAAAAMIQSPLKEVERVLEAAESQARSGGSDILRDNAILTLSSVTSHIAETRAAFARLVDDGTIASRVVVASQNKDNRPLAIMLAALMWRGVDIPYPKDGTWTDYLRINEGFAKLLNDALDYFLTKEDTQLDIFRSVYDGTIAGRSLSTAMFEERIRRENLGRLHPEKVLGDLFSYSRIVDWRLKDKLTSLLALNYDRFVSAVNSVPWSDSLFEAANRLKNDSTASASNFKTQLIERLHKAPPDEWLRAIAIGSEPFKIATQWADRSALHLGISSNLSGALVSAAQGPEIEKKAAQTRWFDLAELLTAPARRKVFEELAAALGGRSPGGLLSLMQAGGVRLINEGGAFGDTSKAITQIIVPLAKSAKGREWLKDRRTEIRQLVARSSPDDIEKLKYVVAANAKAQGAEKRHWASVVTKEWSL